MLISTEYFYIAELVKMPVLTAHYGRHHTKSVCMGIFKLVWWWARKQYFHHRDHSSEPIHVVRSNLGIVVLGHLKGLTLILTCQSVF
jgi:hypothetical protein